MSEHGCQLVQQFYVAFKSVANGDMELAFGHHRWQVKSTGCSYMRALRTLLHNFSWQHLTLPGVFGRSGMGSGISHGSISLPGNQ